MSLLKTELKAKDVMTSEPVCVEPSTTIRELARVFEEHEVSGAPVVDAQGRVIGVVSKSDLIRRCSEASLDVPPSYLFEALCEQDAEEGAMEPIAEPLFCVEDFMTEDPFMVSPEMSLATLAREMFERRIHRAIVVDDARLPLGIVTSLDVLGYFSH
jgi:CBS domain-containing protein